MIRVAYPINEEILFYSQKTTFLKPAESLYGFIFVQSEIHTVFFFLLYRGGKSHVAIGVFQTFDRVAQVLD